MTDFEAFQRLHQPHLEWLGKFHPGLLISMEELWARCQGYSKSVEINRLEAPQTLVIHHTYFDGGDLETFRWFHTMYNGWSDIGYHYLIENGRHGYGTDGRIVAGRSTLLAGAHVRGHNEDSLGIALVGDLDQNRPTDAQMMALQGLLDELMRKYALTTDAIRGHREFPDVRKSCPGKCFDLDMLREKLRST